MKITKSGKLKVSRDEFTKVASSAMHDVLDSRYSSVSDVLLSAELLARLSCRLFSYEEED